MNVRYAMIVMRQFAKYFHKVSVHRIIGQLSCIYKENIGLTVLSDKQIYETELS